MLVQQAVCDRLINSVSNRLGRDDVPANATAVCMLNSSGTLTQVMPPTRFRAIFTTQAEGSDAPKEPEALEENAVKCAKRTSSVWSCIASTFAGSLVAKLLVAA